jgi:hypothetical protein
MILSLPTFHVNPIYINRVFYYNIFMNKVLILKDILSEKIYHLPALKIIFENYPIKSKIKVFQEYLKYCGRKSFNEILNILELDNFDKNIITRSILDKKSFENIEINYNINARTARRLVDKIIDNLIEVI